MKNKKGFTLIELLAIIVILAIIAVITVPIILNIIENSQRGAAQDSAYGYKDAVSKWYVDSLSSNLNIQLHGSYAVSDGLLDGVEIPISGTVPSSGYLTYDNTRLIDGCLTIGDYKVMFGSDGDVISTVKGECDAFVDSSQWASNVLKDTASSTINADGLIEITHSNGDVDYRYMGQNPKNYIQFNCDQNGENCETWRIIGIFGDNLKIVKNDSIGNMYWDYDQSVSNYQYYNDWSRSTLKNYLNGDTSGNYYYSLSSSAKSLIQESTWYLGGIDSSSVTSDEAYVLERGNKTYYSENCDNLEEYYCDNEYPTTISANVGLIYPSDYGYASSSCYSSTTIYDYSMYGDNPCTETDWLYITSVTQWFITSSYGYYHTAWDGYYSGYLTYDSVYGNTLAVRPTVYLKSNIVLTGSGSSGDPYKIG